MENNKTKPGKLLTRALIILAILIGAELIFGLLSYLLDETFPGKFASDGYSMIINRLLVVASWVVGFKIMYGWCKKQNVLQGFFDLTFNLRVVILILIAIALHLGDNLLLYRDITPQAVGEYSYFVSNYSVVQGSIVYFLQVFYYIFEALLVLLMLALFQLAGEIKFNKQYIPWGGIAIALTWGALHFMHGFTAGIYSLIVSLVIGIIYIAGKKYFIPAFVMIFLLFFI